MSELVFKKVVDEDLINSVLNTPEICALTCDDGMADITEGVIHEDLLGVEYISVEEDGILKGIHIVHPINSFCYQGHFNILPEYWGDNDRLNSESIKWFFKEYNILKIVGYITEDSPQVLAHALRIGFKVEGFLEASIIRGGNIIGQHIVSISDVTFDQEHNKGRRQCLN